MTKTYREITPPFQAPIHVPTASAANAILLFLPIVTDIFFYDTWLWWALVQIAANAVLIYCLIKEFITARQKERWICIGAFFTLVALVISTV